MNNLETEFKKQGGWNLIRRYCLNGALFTAICEFILLGKDRIALEILRLSADFMIIKRLAKKYQKTLAQFDQEYDDTLSHERSNVVWVCWLQGIDNAPPLVRKCYESLKANLKGKEIILLDSKNMWDYVQFPEYIVKKWRAGIITDTHISDLLRLELLIKYGGMWVDATVYFANDTLADYYFDSDLFFPQILKPGLDGHSRVNTSWLIIAKTNNRILMATRYLLYQYWRKRDELIDYFLFHDMMSIVLAYYPKEWKAIIPVDNATPHILLLRLFDRFDASMWQAIITQSPYHKLSYKFTDEQVSMEGTNYQKILMG